MRKKTILLIEDNPDDEALMLRTLKKNNFHNEITVMRDGQQAVDYFFGENVSACPVPGLVLLDLKLPKINGLEVLRRIRADERTCFQPVVILTSSTEDHDVVTGYRFGTNSYIRKPVDFDLFVDSVRQIGLYWLEMNEPIPIQRRPA